MTTAFPYHDDHYTWPHVAVIYGDDMKAEILNVHCRRHMDERRFYLVGFIGCDRQVQIDHVAWLAEEIGAETIVFKGVGFTDYIINGLLTHMEEPEPAERPGELCTCIPVDWPNKIQRRVLRKLYDSGHSRRRLPREQAGQAAAHAGGGGEEVRQHLEVLADIGLVEES